MKKAVYLTRKCGICGKAAYFMLDTGQCRALKERDPKGIAGCFSADEAAWLRTGLCPACREIFAGLPAYSDIKESPKGTGKEKNYGI